METNVVLTGECRDVMEDLPEESVHAIVTDPPYGLGFMGNSWDEFDPYEYQAFSQEWAEAALRVLKPGGHLVAFSGNRTEHRAKSGIEDAGFVIRDTLTYHYGGGFPKGLNVGKAIDELLDVEREVVGTEEVDAGITSRSLHANRERDLVEREKTVATSDEAKEWEGWHTNLKPATEFIALARKPFSGTVAENVLEHGTGALNIAETRIPTVEAWDEDANFEGGSVDYVGGESGKGLNNSGRSSAHEDGRHPANVIFDEETAADLDRQAGETGDGKWPGSREGIGYESGAKGQDGLPERRDPANGSGPSRYFYTSKANKSERTLDGRIENEHPTVKPLDLTEWLVRLVSAENQLVLDPFAGSGTTPRAAKNLGRRFIGIEKQQKWAEVARVRCGLTPDDPSIVRDDDEGQVGIEAFTE